MVSNMDYWFPDELLDLTFLGKFYRDDELIFEGTFIFGYIGVIRFSRSNQYALFLNSRLSNKNINDLINSLKYDNIEPTIFTLFEMALNVEKYQDAI